MVKRVAQYEVVEENEATVITAPSPETLFPKALLHTSTVAHILTSKFALGVPHYRLEQDLLDQGMRLDRGLMSRYVEHAGNTLGATIVAAMWRNAIANANGQMISTDATGAAIQPTKAKDGKACSTAVGGECEAWLLRRLRCRQPAHGGVPRVARSRVPRSPAPRP